MLVLPLHGHLAPAAWAAAEARARTARSDTSRRSAAHCRGACRATSRELRDRDLLAGPRHRGRRVRRRARGDQRRRSARRRGASSAGTRSSPGPARGSSARTRVTATAGWPRSTPRTPRSRSVCRRWSRRGSPAPTRARATAGSATTPRPFSSCCWAGPGPGAGGERRASGRPAGRTPGRSEAARRAPRGVRRAPRHARPAGRPRRRTRRAGCRRRRWAATLAEDPLFFAAALAAGRALARRSGEWVVSGLERISSRGLSTRARSPTSASTSSATPDGATSSARSSPIRVRSRSSPTTTTHLYLVRQPREAVGEPALLELPAGKLDVEGESRA